MPTTVAPFAPRAFIGASQHTEMQALCRIPEPEALSHLLLLARSDAATAARVHSLARRLAGTLRERKGGAGRAGLVQSLLQEFSLSSQEGVALMCLAEALLRIPDKATRDALIRDKIGNGQWEAHLGKSPSLFVNAATWGLLLTGKLVATHSERTLTSMLARLTAKGGEPLIRKSVDMAMRMMGEQFVTGETIAQALSNARARETVGFRFSYDMLGEAALTQHDAERYLASYEAAIHAIGRASGTRGIYTGPGISIKLSALHPRYVRAQSERVHAELYPTLLSLATLARQYDIGLNIDAEETERLEISLELLERLCHEEALAGWNGLGFVIQAYQKRCPAVVDEVIEMARHTGRRLMIRLVKGAYWDSEIKRAQVDGLSDFPVYTRKAHTDVSYIACARKLLAAPDAVYPQFATHNAHTLAAIHEMANPATYQPDQYEFQCLHGMGEPLYEQVVRPVSEGGLGRPCRVYAPVGTHETLLAYLVRRLLENGANTSFVNRIADETIALDELVRDPVETVDAAAAVEGAAALPHQRIAHPMALYGEARRNSAGLDLASETVLADLDQALQASRGQQWLAGPLLACDVAQGTHQPVRNPADSSDTVGQVQEAEPRDVEHALSLAHVDGQAWRTTPAAERAQALLRAADLLQADMPTLIALLVREAGKSASNAISEVREAIDFLRYYATQASSALATPQVQALGTVVCISPWNFPLAIFAGQVCAALAAGNCVIAKPAEQTPLIAAQAVRLLWQAGVPRAALQLLPGRGETVGATLVADPRVMGVVFTGSTQVARAIQQTLAGRLDAAGRPVTLIAETGGQNAMVVDSSALAEQAVVDILASAFDSAGQRCSALRVLCIQEDAAPHLLPMLRGAMGELRLGNPAVLATDVGPVIDTEAQAGIVAHIDAMRARGCTVFQSHDTAHAGQGTFVSPTLIELQSISQLEREVFGPVLHVVRFARNALPRLLEDINATGYGLTLGVHTRIDETIAQILARAHAGNAYVNRNMVGAVVGVQPFGGEGLSGTGPKAGGPLYLRRLVAQAPSSARSMICSAETEVAPPRLAPLDALQQWASTTGRTALATTCETFVAQSPAGLSQVLPGPTGERNVYSVLPRATTGCLATQDDDLLTQLAAVLAVGSQALWQGDAAARLREQLPANVQQHITLPACGVLQAPELDVVLQHGSAADLQRTCEVLAKRQGAIVLVQGLAPGEKTIALDRLVLERSLSVNTAAAGGNASLMTIG
ncbi:MAG: trifunctional transcriptional regulator/proline dehydrogenase/L-glutamate gamma-semialdehyde dehydrogenase [Giesbergeria sp.]